MNKKDDKLKKLTLEQEMIKNSSLFSEIYKGQEELIDHLTKIYPFPPLETKDCSDILEIYETTDDKVIL